VNAVILAAGRGTRLGGLTSTIPKSLIEVGNTTLLGWSLARLRDAGCSRVVIVTGHEARSLMSHAREAQPDLDLVFVHNERFAETGSGASLLCAASEVSGEPFLLLESDLLYHPGFVEAVTADHSDTCLAVATPTGSGDEVHVAVDRTGLLADLGKGDPHTLNGSVAGELAGISKIGPSTLSVLQRSAANRLEGLYDYEDLLMDAVAAGERIGVVAVLGLPWTEVDTESDLRRARDVVWPRLQGAD
jgi:2-aminoethylphosphonate-pyruvate transaminase